MYVYADVVMLLNIIINSIILSLTAVAAGISYRWWRILMAAAVGGVYALLEVLPSLSVFYTAPVKFIASVFLVFLAFGRQKYGLMIFLVGVFYLISFLLGGAVVGWFFFTERDLSLSSGEWLQPTLLQLAAGIAIGVLLIMVLIRRIIAHVSHKQILYPIKLYYAGQCVELISMLDTGNRLYTPVGRKPVIIVEYTAILPLLGESIAAYLCSHPPESWLLNLDECQDESWISRAEIIPYQAVGKRSMLLGFRLDRLTAVTEKGVVQTKEIVAALYHGSLSPDGTYAALLHSAVLTNYKKEEANQCA